MKLLFFDRKAQELSLNVIIIAALGLIVLVIVVLIFMRESGESSDTLNSCYTQGGDCVAPVTGSLSGCPPDSNFVFGGKCDGDKKCCIALREKTVTPPPPPAPPAPPAAPPAPPAPPAAPPAPSASGG